MTGLKIWRNIVGFAWIAVFIWGVVSLFRANWPAFGIAVVVWFLLGLVFMRIHGALENAELGSVEVYASRIADAVELEQWSVALSLSEKSVQTLAAAANRDRTAVGGNGARMQGPLAFMMVGHAILLGANGRLDDARAALDQWFAKAEAFGGDEPQLRPLFQVVRQLQGPFATVQQFQEAAHLFHSFL